MKWMINITLACLAAVCLNTASAAPPPAGEESGSGSNAQRGARAITHVDSYVSIEPIIAAVQSNNNLRGIIHIEFGLEVPRGRDRREIEVIMPLLRNAYSTAVSTYTGMNDQYGDVPDVDRISRLLQSATDQVAGDDKAEVLLAMVIVHGR